MIEARQKKTDAVGFHLYAVSKTVTLIETESGVEVTKGYGRGKTGIV